MQARESPSEGPNAASQPGSALAALTGQRMPQHRGFMWISRVRFAFFRVFFGFVGLDLFYEGFMRVSRRGFGLIGA